MIYYSMDFVFLSHPLTYIHIPFDLIDRHTISQTTTSIQRIKKKIKGKTITKFTSKYFMDIIYEL